MDNESVNCVYTEEETQRFAHDVGYAAAFLDIECPGWAPRIDIDRLNLGSCRYCILGQLYAPTLWERLTNPDLKYMTGFGRGYQVLQVDAKGIEPNVFACDRMMRDHWLHEIAARLTEKDTPCVTSSVASRPSTSPKPPAPVAG